MKKNNKGFTMVELIIVLAIIGVFMSVLSFSSSILLRNESREASQTVNALLSSCKIEAMTGVNSKLEISLEDGKYIVRLYQNDTDFEEEILGDENLGIIYKLKSTGDTLYKIGTEPLAISFNSETGAIEGTDVNLIDFNAGYKITIYPSTGYFELNK